MLSYLMPDKHEAKNEIVRALFVTRQGQSCCQNRTADGEQAKMSLDCSPPTEYVFVSLVE